MSSALDRSVSRADAGDGDSGKWNFDCPVFTNELCGFQSHGWPNKTVAKARGRQHFDEHKGQDPTPELLEFREAQGLTGRGELPDGAVRLEDI